MSLLMDALKRAESSKQAVARNLTGGVPGNKVPDLSLEPIAGRPAVASKSLPDLAQHIDSLNADLAAGAPSSKPTEPPSTARQQTQTTSTEDDNRAAIRNAFAAKAINPPSRKPLFLALGGLGVAALVIGTYVWVQLQNINKGTINAPRPDTSHVASSTPSPAPYSPPAAPVPAVAIFAQNSPSTVSNATEAAPPALPAKNPSRRSPPTDDETKQTSIRVTRTPQQPDAHVQRAYAYLQSNALDQAQHEYAAALRSDPNNVDALMGLAAIAQRQGHRAEAERYQQRALEADPRDAGAQAAALSSKDPMTAESRLKSLLAAQPESAPLNFALGNLYAGQNRWNEAQQCYFDAVAGDIDNPDYLFNLAVSLDQLRQSKLAAQHYRRALEAGENRPGVFDRERATRRLNQLNP